MEPELHLPFAFLQAFVVDKAVARPPELPFRSLHSQDIPPGYYMMMKDRETLGWMLVEKRIEKQLLV